jgi:hypothetical protein
MQKKSLANIPVIINSAATPYQAELVFLRNHLTKKSLSTQA